MVLQPPQGALIISWKVIINLPAWCEVDHECVWGIASAKAVHRSGSSDACVDRLYGGCPTRFLGGGGAIDVPLLVGIHGTQDDVSICVALALCCTISKETRERGRSSRRHSH
jgi:hypothetical protein